MASITWTGAAGDGNYNNPANWSPAQVPGSADTAIISEAAATAIAVNNSEAIGSLTINKSISLTLGDNQSFTFGSGTAVSTFSNAGTFTLNSTYNNTNLIVGGAKLTLSGAGTIAMGNYPANRIYGAASTSVLNNVNNLIEGAGQLGAGSLSFTNGAAGVVKANASNQLILNTGSLTVTNAGLLEATVGSGGLVIQSAVNDGTSGKVAAAGGNVYLGSGALISGGTLSSSGGAAILDSNNATLSGLANTGSIVLQDNTSLSLLGTITNQGTIALASNYNNTNLIVSSTGTQAGTVTLTGNGTVALGDYPANRLYGAIAADTLVNLNNTISGAGQLGVGQLTLVNDATIDATGGNALYLNTAGTATNAGLIEATGAGGLVIQSAIDSSSGGTILAAGSTVSLAGATLAGGLVTSSTVGTLVGAVIDSGGATLDGSAHTLSNTGLIDVNDNQALTLVGTIANHGTIALNSTYNTTYLYVASDVVVNGAGTIVLGDYNNANQIRGAGTAGSVFDNVNNIIRGAGAIGPNLGSFINEAAGVVNASTSDNSIIIDAAAVTNLGLMEATGAGGLSLQTTISNAGGTILAAGGNVYLDGAAIAGGLLSSTGTSALVVNASSTLDGTTATVTNAGTIGVNDNQSLSLLGTISNTGTIGLNSSYNDTNLIASSPTVSLTGGGSIVLGNYNTANRIYGTSSAVVLNNVNNTISGAGQIGVGQLTFDNLSAGIVDANFSGNQIVLNSASAIANAGLIEATAGGTITLQTVLSDGSAGRLVGNGGVINLNGGTVQGGTLSTINGGSVVDTTGGTLDGTANTVLSTAVINVNDNQTLYLDGAISNAGTIALNSNYNYTNLVAASPTVTLTGGGTVLLGNYNTSNRIYGSANATVLNNVNNTISGAGQIGAAQLTFNNAKLGVVNANFSGNQIILNSASAITNAGLIEATAGGTITLQTVLDSSSGGTLLGNGGVIALNGGTVAGGLLSTVNGGGVVVTTGGVLDGSAHLLTSNAAIGINDNQTLYLQGSIANNGSISINSSYNYTNLIVNTPTVTLTGTGTITLGDYGEYDRIYASTAADVLNNVGNTINGGGQLGAGQLTLINSGIVAATGANALIVNLGSTGTNTAAGQMLGIGAGGLSFQNGTYTNSGTIQADSGSSVTFQAGAVLTNDSATGVLTGGTYGAVSAGGTATASASFGGAAVASDNATLLLSGVGSSLSFGGVSLQSSLKSIGTKGSLSVLNGQAFSNGHGLTNNGSITLGGGTFTTKGLTNKGVVSGFGTLAGNVTDTGSIVATGGELTLTGKANSITGTLSGSGTLAFKGVDTLNAGTVLNVAEIALINAATLNLAASVSFGGTFDMQGTASVAGPGGFTNSGLFEHTGSGTGSVSAPFTNSGSISVAAGGTLAFTGGLANSGTILDNGVFTDSAVLTGGKLTVGAASTSATLGAGSSTISTLTLGGGALNTSGGTVTVTGDYNNTAAGVGNSYNPFAGVTGTINGQGTQLAVIGVNGTTITSVNGTLTISVAPGGTAHFEIENTGAAGSAALRGALQTTVNGGTIHGTALTGSGVHAADFGPIAAGATSGVYTINDSGGAFSGEAIHLASDFANVAGLTIDIVQQGQAAAPPASSVLSLGHMAVQHDALAWLPAHHAG